MNFKLANFVDPEVSILQQHLKTFLGFLQNQPLLWGTLLTDVVLSTGVDNIVNHGLQRKVQGWIAVNSNAQATLWQPTTTNPFPERHLFLRTSAAVTVSLWIF